MKKSVTIIFCLIIACGAIVYFSIPSLPAEASGNRWNLWKVLFHYKWIDRDEQKFEAARFLIDNMPYHKSRGTLLYVPKEVKRQRVEADSIYASIRIAGLEEKMWRDSLNRVGKRRWEKLKDSVIPEVTIDAEEFCDIHRLSDEFLIKHIDNAFQVWKESIFARQLTFDEFREYILPYRSVGGTGFHVSGEEWRRWFGKYISVNGVLSMRETVQRYNQAVNQMQGLNGNSKREVPAGAYDLYVKGMHDCVDIANYGCNVLRACGLPVAVEYNVAYRSLQGNHYHCNVWNAAKGEWQTFNPLTSLPGDGDWAFAETMNVYRMMYGARKDTPYFLKRKNEHIPELLNDPCIMDVTSNLRKTVTVELPCDVQDCNLAYLATFHKESGGMIAVTWGEVKHDKKTATFRNVIPDILYFPVCYPSREATFFGDPFYVRMINDQPQVCALSGIQPGTQEKGTLTLARKYPRKPKMIKVAKELVGSCFIGANKKDFSDAVVLYEIKQPPLPHFLEYPLTTVGKFRYYRFQTTRQYPYANISMLEWITSSEHGYKNTMLPTRPDILIPEDTVHLQKERNRVKLLDDSWDNMVWKAEYDGKRDTAPGAYPNITLWLKEPQIISHVRFAPLNADNGVRGGDVFRLHYWDKGWQLVGETQAEYEYVTFHDVPKNKLYWLENMSTGKEEMPFVMIDGEQQFIYL